MNKGPPTTVCEPRRFCLNAMRMRTMSAAPTHTKSGKLHHRQDRAELWTKSMSKIKNVSIQLRESMDNFESLIQKLVNGPVQVSVIGVLNIAARLNARSTASPSGAGLRAERRAAGTHPGSRAGPRGRTRTRRGPCRRRGAAAAPPEAPPPSMSSGSPAPPAPFGDPWRPPWPPKARAPGAPAFARPARPARPAPPPRGAPPAQRSPGEACRPCAP